MFGLWQTFAGSKSPSLRGSGLKYWKEYPKLGMQIVSLFTREWIEIPCFVFLFYACFSSPSLRGSGLKYLMDYGDEVEIYVSLFTREWIEMLSL